MLTSVRRKWAYGGTGVTVFTGTGSVLHTRFRWYKVYRCRNATVLTGTGRALHTGHDGKKPTVAATRPSSRRLAVLCTPGSRGKKRTVSAS